jgi:hypothetical protein
MTKAILLLSSLCIVTQCFSTNATAQVKELEVKTKINTDRSVDFSVDKHASGTYTLVLNFRELTNTTGISEPVYKIKNSTNSFLKLSPLSADQNIGLSYTYRYIRGELKPKYNALFLYAMPYSNGKKVRVAESSFVNATYFGSTTPDDWKVYRFYTEKADTVTSVRKGTVVSVSDLYDQDNKDIAYTSKVNAVIIEHADGSLATYRGFKKGIFVKEGQTVFPGTALGINSMTNDRFNISLMLTYLKSVDFESPKNLKESKSLYGFITPYFCTVENLNGILNTQKYYTALITPEIIQKEMTKKEIKNLDKQ